MNKTDFSTLNLQPELLKNVLSLGYETMTPVQAQSLPPILQKKDVIAQAKTGSGKTAAFGLGLLSLLKVSQFRIQALIICPTRELADQVAKEIRKLARTIHNVKVLTLCGGAPFGPQIGSLEHGAHIIVGTPGRIEEHLTKNTLNLAHLNLLVLDEADRMLEMGFQSSIDAIIERTPVNRQTLLFSATYPEEIQKISQDIMRQPVMITVEAEHDHHSITQHFFKVDDNQQRMKALRLLLLDSRPESTVVFCNTKRETQEIANRLAGEGFSVLALHGDLEQKERDQTLVQFVNKSISILVATDVAARGLDIDSLDLVINYQVARDTQVHIHRTGRTGRAGKQGVACSLYDDSEGYKVALIGDYLDRIIESEVLPAERSLKSLPITSSMVTLQIDGGKKQKLRPGDILGALTGANGVKGNQVGKIQVFSQRAYVAVSKEVVSHALNKLETGKMKGRAFRVRILKS